MPEEIAPILSELEPLPPRDPVWSAASLDSDHAVAFIAACLAVVALPEGKQASDILGGTFSVNSDGTAIVRVQLKP